MFHISDDVDLKHAFESSMILFFIFYEKLEDFYYTSLEQYLLKVLIILSDLIKLT